MSVEELGVLTKNAKNSISSGNFTDAEYYFKKMTKIESSNWYAWYGRGLCFKRMEMYERAIHCFVNVTELQEEKAKAWYNLGFCESQVDQLEDAIFHLNKAVKIDPNYAIAYVIKAWLFYKHKKMDSARSLLTHVKDKFPEFVKTIEVLDSENLEKEPRDSQICYDLLIRGI